MINSLVLAGIGGYQRYISPRKGFRCAYSVAHGGTGCSGYVKQAVAEVGVFKARGRIRQRFADCKAAAMTMNNGPWDKKKSKRKSGGSGCVQDVCGSTIASIILGPFVFCGLAASETADAPTSDITPEPSGNCEMPDLSSSCSAADGCSLPMPDCGGCSCG